MTTPPTPHNSQNHGNLPPEDRGSQLPFAQGDELDVLLREWHDANRTKAAAGRDRLLAALRAEDAVQPTQHPVAVESKPAPGLRIEGSEAGGWKLWRIAPLAAAAVLTLAVLIPFMLPPGSESVASAKLSNIVMCPEGGKLEAYDAGAMLLGACILKHTDVAAEITGHVARVTLTQTFENPHRDKVEALYTFPMSHRGAVDRMSMAIGDRVIVGEVKERDEAREIYENALDAGLVAGLTEQERPNIFTQSVANIEPGATIAVTLSYVEFVEEKDGEFSFAFPTVVAPRYIPGSPITGDRVPGLPADLKLRRGLVLQGPASIKTVDRGSGFSRSYRTPDETLLAAAINGATPIETPTHLADPDRWIGLEVKYADGVVESGQYYDPSAGHIAMGHIGGRWYALPTGRAIPTTDVDGLPASGPGAAFAPNTDQVPDASRITPMPVRPGTRSGQDISISVKIDTGGPGILAFKSPLHETVNSDGEKRSDGLAKTTTIALKKLAAIPNRDFVLSWKQTAEGVTDQVFTHTGKHGNFFGLMLRPPARVDDTMAVPREMIFVVDTSGSMRGFPIEKSKEVMEKALASMRPGDTFNVITFAGATRVLWPTARPVNEANLAEARALLAQQNGQGGTEMMTAINAALEQSPAKVDKPAFLKPEQLLSVYPKGQAVRIVVPTNRFAVRDSGPEGPNAAILDDSGGTMINVRVDNALFAIKAPSLLIEGIWKGSPSGQVLELTSIDAAAVDSIAGVRPLRIVMFLTDGLVGNENAIIDAVKRHRGTTRVFSFGIGNSVNRYLLDSIASEGGGAAEYVLLESEAAPAVERLTRRTLTPVLTDIRLEFSDNLSVLDIMPPLTNIPDLFDEQPVTILGRYTAPGAGTVTLRGNTAAGPWERTITLSLPERQPEHDTLATMWARAKIERVKSQDLRGVQNGTFATELKEEIVRLGEQFGIMSEYTSFVAVDKLRVTIAGKPRLINVPIELPAGTSFEGFFGQPMPTGDDEQAGRGANTWSKAAPQILTVDQAGTDELKKLGAVDRAELENRIAEHLSANAVDAASRAAPGLGGNVGTDLAAAVAPPAPAPSATLAPPISHREALEAKPAAPAAEAAPTLTTSIGDQSLRKAESGARGSETGGKGGAEGAAKGKTDQAPPTGPGGASKGAPAQQPTAKPREEAVVQRLRPRGADSDPASRSNETMERNRAFGLGKDLGGKGGQGVHEGAKVTEQGRGLQRLEEQERARAAGDEKLRAAFRMDVDGDSAEAASDLGTAGFPLVQQISVTVNEPQRKAQANWIVPVQQVALRVGQLANEKQIDQARVLACDLAKAAPDYAVGREMCVALNEQKVQPEVQSTKVAELADRARRELEAAARQMELYRKLDARLLTLVMGAGPMATAQLPASDVSGCSNLVPLAARQVAAQAGVEFQALTGAPADRQSGVLFDKLAAAEAVEQGVLVTVLVTGTAPAVLEQLKGAGLMVEDVAAKASVVIGVIPVGRLAELVMLECVKRVEPTGGE